MSKYETLWTSKNGRWEIYKLITSKGTFIQVSDGYWVDNPIMYDNGTVAYDNPYRLPKYVRAQVEKIMRKLS